MINKMNTKQKSNNMKQKYKNISMNGDDDDVWIYYLVDSVYVLPAGIQTAIGIS